jgi:prophage regulatory protein
MALRLIRLKEVLKRVSIGKSKIYADIEKGQFPKPIRLGPNAVAWLEDDIESWIQEKIDASREIV